MTGTSDPRHHRASWVLLVAAGLVLAGCSAPDRPEPAGPSVTPTTTSSPQPSTRPSTPVEPAPVPATESVVLAISVDGLNPDALTTLGRSGAPSFWRLIDGGASTLNARTDHELTITLPNHTGMLTGRPVTGASGTSVTFNDDNGSTLEQVHGAYVPSMFDVAHDHGVGTALFAEKDKFAFLVRSWDRNHGAPDDTGADDGPDKLDLAAIAPSTELVGDVTDALTSGDARLVFWHVAAPDAAGHAAGWLGPAYLAAVRDADTQIGTVLDAITADPELAARTTALLTADHGGPRGVDHHDDAGLEANYRIPFIAWGAGVRRGGDLYALSSGRQDPADASPGGSGPQPIRNTDLAGVALGVLGLPAIDGAPTSALAPIVLD
jgi:predicted AlkP superfamily pyrophosphatase or phosphodiesterase